MHLAMIGLGKMGGNMVRRLRLNGIKVTGYDHAPAAVAQLAEESGMQAAQSVADAVAKLPSPRIIWLMLPSGSPTESQLVALAPMLDKGDIIIDGGNSNYKESQRRGAWLAERGIGFMDAGTSGGIWGLENGYCLMVGATPEVAKTVQPILEALAPKGVPGWAHVGPVGAGHFTKMIHNGIEYGMMQAFAEGLDLMRGKEEFNLDLAQITELWRHSSVVRSWLLDLTADALKTDQKLDHIKPYVPDSGEGRWTVVESIEQGVAAPVLTLALQMRFASQDERGYSYRLLSLMRNAFGGHAVAMAPDAKATAPGKTDTPVGKVDPNISSDKPKPPATSAAVPGEDVKTPDAPPDAIASSHKPAPQPAETQVIPPKDKK
jgi:6-phosphogluconate dehydrogenase